MPSTSSNGDAETPLVGILARVQAGELPLAAAVPVLAGSPAAEPALRRFRLELRKLRLPPGHPLPWAAVYYGLDEPERCARHDVARAARLVERLRRLPPERRLGKLQRAKVQSENPALIDALIAEAQRVVGDDPDQALGWLELAVLAVQRLIVADFPTPLLYPGWLRLEAHRANGFRVKGDLAEADRRFRALASDRRRRELARLEVEAELLSLEGSLRIDLRQLDRADELLKRAERLYRRVGERVGIAQVLLKRGSAAFYAGDPSRAAEYERQAGDLLDPEADARLYAMSRQNLADTLVDLGDPARAAGLLRADQERFEAIDDTSFRLRWRWIEARVARAEGRHEDAERLLLEVRDAWLAHDRPYDAELATLELAELALARGDRRRVKRRAAPLVPLFEARGVHREAQRASALLQQAAKSE